MPKIYHILNGDALKERFPESIKGDLIIFRECLVDGPVKANTLEKFFKIRSQYLCEQYPIVSEKKEYYEHVVPEFQKLQNIEENAEVNLWFEDDLFCQVNFWCCAYFLAEKNSSLYLVRPPFHNRYGFGGLPHSKLVEAFNNKLKIEEIKEIANLWVHYTNESDEQLIKTANNLKDDYPFIKNAAKAYLDSIPKNDNEGKPKELLKTIISEFPEASFGKVFKEFHTRLPIYGFGDLQVKRLYEEIEKKN